MDQETRVEVHKIAPETMDSEKLKRFFGYWQGLCADCDLPRRHDLSPVDLGFILGQVTMVDVLRPSGSFYLRLIGTRIEELGRLGDQGKTVDQLRPASYRQLCQDAYQEIVSQGHPICLRISSRDLQRTVAYERLVVPFTTTGEAVEVLFDALDWPAGSQSDLKRFRLLPSANILKELVLS